MVFPSANFLFNDRVLTTYLFYWLAGCFVGAQYEKARDWFYKNKNLVLLVFVLLTIAEEILSYIHFSGLRYINWLENIHFMFCVSALVKVLLLYALFKPL